MNGSKVVDPVDKHFEPNLYHVFYVLVYAILNHSLLGELSVMLLVNGGRIWTYLWEPYRIPEFSNLVMGLTMKKFNLFQQWFSNFPILSLQEEKWLVKIDIRSDG